MLRTQVFERTGLTCSVGIAPNRTLAKVSSDVNKPNGQYVVEANKGCILDFIKTLPVRKVCFGEECGGFTEDQFSNQIHILEL